MADPTVLDATETIVTGWGRTRPARVRLEEPRNVDATKHLVTEARSPMVARGLGRSYGDAAQLSGGTAVSLKRMTVVSWVNADEGTLRVGAGVPLSHLIDRFVPQGWFIPVSPGTRNVTVGGAIAADIHGKNHHQDGSWCNFVEELRLVIASGEEVIASRTNHPDLFWATCGGMGLTGIITEAVISMTPITSSIVAVETQRTSSLDELMDAMEASDAKHRFSVAWVDFMHQHARGVLTQGDFATDGRLARPGSPAATLPRIPHPRLVQAPFVRAFNELWFRRAPADATVTEESITAFFHPLDAITNWNRMYGSAGFHQWQIALPEKAREVLRSITQQLHAAKAPAFFAVLKRFGPGNEAPLSFPMKGWTLALDLPAGNQSTDQLLRTLDLEVVDAGGRIYLAKDSRMDGALLPQMYPRLEEWRETRDRWDPNRRFQSDLAERLKL